MQKKKSLGQHFLKSAAYLRAVAAAADIQEGDRVLEIGPGDGALTKELLLRGASVIAVEKDRRLIPLLQEKFKKEIANGALTLAEGDALEFDPSELKVRNYKLVANIPYYITGALLKKFLSGKRQPERLVFLIQKEVAQRIAKEKKEGILSLSVKAYGTPTYVKTVPAGAFSPPPSVDSAILLVNDISRNNFQTQAHERRFFELVRAGFSQKRKLLKNNLSGTLEDAEERVREAGIPPSARAEDVGLAQWLELSR